MINRASLQAAFDLLDLLKSKGIEAIIAGGCARDIFFGVKPKDIDIIVVDTEMDVVEAILAEANVAAVGFHLYRGETTSDRIIGGFKLVGAEIDVVLYSCNTVSEAIDAFDFNLNQFAIVDTRHGIDGAFVRFVGKHHWGQLVAVREDASPSRKGRMWDKYIDLIPRRATGELINEAPVGGDDGPF
ncbi:hypothetical protein [Ectopseudomonas oleovorans]|uniref:Poly A polymerase head domain-containing protein n=1 Tax=Ectopseudomonas oleovorans TaxID=301 RepID=A0AA42U0L4_ECTOL|nr:hypothetical protein [Pseudomonas oleovorans]MDH1340548.1 hypothetical protein [Pseudomonas oleovorans]MDH1491520.1 hypothetical protein [Pseudomonas oleovorans]WGG22395.1 hypothetical protein N5O83_06920 [Pseudomonas oleovorans]